MNRAELPERFSAAATSRLIWWGTLIVLLYSVWVWAGLRPSFQHYGFYGSLVLAAGLLLAGPLRCLKSILRDPVFWLGLLFIGYLFIQWYNSGRFLYLDGSLNEWRYSDPPYPGWPSAINSDDAWQMITWFMPAWLLVVAVRSPHFNLSSRRRLLVALVVSAGLLGVFGLVQYFSGTKQVYWVTPFSAGFYASFAYRNHAASFFTMMAMAGAGLFYLTMFKGPVRRRGGVLLMLAVSVMSCLVSLLFCGSRAAVIFCGLCVLIMGLAGVVLVWHRGGAVQRLHAVSIMVVALAALALVTAGPAQEVIKKEFFPKRPAAQKKQVEPPGKTPIIDLSLSPEIRFMMVQSAWAMWKEHPWLGVGGWGFRYLQAFYVPVEKWGEVKKTGRANVHVDALQYLAEFGLAGFSLLALIMMMMVRDVWRAGMARPFIWLSCSGLVMVLAHSMIDIPFRSPGVMYHFVMILAALPRVES